MESIAFFIFTGVIGYIFYWSIKNDDVQTRIDQQKRGKKADAVYTFKKR